MKEQTNKQTNKQTNNKQTNSRRRSKGRKFVSCISTQGYCQGQGQGQGQGYQGQGQDNGLERAKGFAKTSPHPHSAWSRLWLHFESYLQKLRSPKTERGRRRTLPVAAGGHGPDAGTAAAPAPAISSVCTAKQPRHTPTPQLSPCQDGEEVAPLGNQACVEAGIHTAATWKPSMC
jgi:hypothetical protein